MSKFKLIKEEEEVWWVSTKQFDLEIDGIVSSFRAEESPKWTYAYEYVENEGWQEDTERAKIAISIFMEFQGDWPDGEMEIDVN